MSGTPALPNVGRPWALTSRALGALTDGKDGQPCGPALARRLRETVIIEDNC